MLLNLNVAVALKAELKNDVGIVIFKLKMPRESLYQVGLIDLVGSRVGIFDHVTDAQIIQNPISERADEPSNGGLLLRSCNLPTVLDHLQLFDDFLANPFAFCIDLPKVVKCPDNSFHDVEFLHFLLNLAKIHLINTFKKDFDHGVKLTFLRFQIKSILEFFEEIADLRLILHPSEKSGKICFQA